MNGPHQSFQGAAQYPPVPKGRILLGHQGTAATIVFVEHALGHSVRRPIEPALRFGFFLAERAARTAFHHHTVDSDRDDRPAADVSAAPLPAATPEGAPDREVRMIHGL